MKTWWQALVAALQFMTRLPLPIRVPYDARTIGRSPAFFPLCGWVIGLFPAALSAWLPSGAAPVTALLALILWTAATGGLHLDGLMDTADGLGSYRSRERMLEIMKDSRVGAMGAIAGMLLLAAKGVCLWFVADQRSVGGLAAEPLIYALIAIPAMGRWLVVLAITRWPYIGGENGMGSLYRDTGWRELAIASVFTLLPLTLMPSPMWLVLPAAQWMIGIGVAVYCRRRLGGLTGDIYGAIIEVSEAAGLLASVYLFLCRGGI